MKPAFYPDRERTNAWTLYADDQAMSHVDLDDPEHIEFGYIRDFTHVIDSMSAPPAPLRVLHLGAGALTLARYLGVTRPGSYQQAVDIDADLVALVREKAPLPRGVKVKMRIGDAREVLAAAPEECYDVIVGDVFRGSRLPSHLTSVEFLADVRRVLRPNGAYLANFGDGAGSLNFAKSMAATIRAAFPYACMLGDTTVLRGRRFGNMILAGGTAPFDERDLTRRAARNAFPTRFLTAEDLKAFTGGAPAVTDETAVESPKPPTLSPVFAPRKRD